MSNPLPPCPICGGEGAITPGYWVQCQNGFCAFGAVAWSVEDWKRVGTAVVQAYALEDVSKAEGLTGIHYGQGQWRLIANGKNANGWTLGEAFIALSREM